jgi:hypothetical protein
VPFLFFSATFSPIPLVVQVFLFIFVLNIHNWLLIIHKKLKQMKQFSLFLLVTVVLCMVGAEASAHDFELKNSDGQIICYTKYSNHDDVFVTYRGSSYDEYSDEYTGVINIPETISVAGITMKVEAIGANAFRGCSGLTSVTIPNSVKNLYNTCFKGCI